jgi:hypothetical protein
MVRYHIYLNKFLWNLLKFQPMRSSTKTVWLTLSVLEGKTYKDLPDDMKEYLNEFWDTLTVDDIIQNNFIAEGLGLGDIEESYSHSAFMEVLAYWLIYFEPYMEDEEKAISLVYSHLDIKISFFLLWVAVVWI